AWQAALLVLKEEGAQVVAVDLPRPEEDIYRTVQRPEASLTHMEKGWAPEKFDLYTESTRTNIEKGQQVLAVDYLRAQHQRRVFSNIVRSVLQHVDALVLPTMPFPAPTIEQTSQDILIDGVAVFILSLTLPFNLSGLPAVSFPCGFTPNNLPIGLQVVGKPFEEATILRIAHGYQQLTDWHRREAIQ
ncbi:MAG: amidase, partial [Chloroflexota bacterium]|nr:amidase [Chloroflexota bacterium]